VQIHEIDMHAKYQVAMRNIVKVIANVNVGANQPTDQQTDRAKTICPPVYTGGHKNVTVNKLGSKCIRKQTRFKM